MTPVLLIALWPDIAASSIGRCRPQRPQRFLIRSSYIKKGAIDGIAHLKALRYRVAEYGTVEGSPVTGTHQMTAASMAVNTQFFGHTVRVNRRIVPALQCVQDRIERQCTKPKDSYIPRHVGGLRTSNTIRGAEFSNHLFGIAIDIDPDRNPCCHCVGAWQQDPKCSRESKSPFDRAELPACWIDNFEYFGFYWLGRDTLEDTMHFEFLGKPEKIKR